MKKQSLVIFSLLLIFIQSYDSTVLSTCSCTGTVSNCGICSASTCTKCLAGYQLNSGANTCTAYPCTIPGCSACSADGKTCLKCTNTNSFYDPLTLTCVNRCPLSNCGQCLAGSTSCIKCNDGFTLYRLTNQCISNVINNCLTIHDFPYTEFRCTLCLDGFKPSKDQTQCIGSACTSIADCQSCTSASVCDRCRVGYSFTGGKCQPNTCNVQRCMYCSSTGACLRCQSNYTLVNNECVPRTCTISNCASCKAGSMYCDNCNSGYALNIWTNKCQSSSSSLIFLWFLVIPVFIIIGIIAFKVLTKNKKDQDNIKVMQSNENLQGTEKPSEKRQTAVDLGNIKSTQHLNTTQNEANNQKGREEYQLKL